MNEPQGSPYLLSPNQSYESLGNDVEMRSIPISIDMSDDDSSSSDHHSQRDSPDLCEKQYFNFEIESANFVQTPDVSANQTASFNTPDSSLHHTGTSSLNDSRLGRNISLSISQEQLADSIDRSSNPVNASLPRGTRTRSRFNMNDWGKAVTVSKHKSKNGRILHEPDEMESLQPLAYFNSFCGRLIGSGNFAATYEVESKELGRHAVKKMLEGSKKFYIEKDVFNHETLEKHPNVVEFYRAFIEDKTLFIQMELCRFSCKNLYTFFTSCNENCNSQWLLLSDCCKGLFHMHSMKVVHLDVKPDNILLGSDWNFKLCDFGCSAKNKEQFVLGEHVDNEYEAPELRGKVVTNKSDVYALGQCIIYLTNRTVYMKDEDLFDVVAEMKDGNYTKRPNASEILKNEVVASKDVVQFRNDIRVTLGDAIERNSNKHTEQTPNIKAFYKILGQNNSHTSTPKASMSVVPKKLFYD